MKIVIPMSGKGQRFLNAGYKDIKPLIKVEGKPIIEHIVSMFPGEDDFIFICNNEHLRDTNIEDVLLRLKPSARIISIAPHNKGPVYAVLKSKKYIEDDEPVIVNYCDFNAWWNYEDFKRTLH